MGVKEEVIELQKQYIRDNARDARTIYLPRLKAIDLIAQEAAIFGSKTPEDLAGETLFGMVMVLTDENNLTLGD